MSAELEKHLNDCAACRRELDAMRGDASLLALTVAGPTPPARSRERLLSAVKAGRQDSERDTLPGFAVRRPWWSFAPVFASLVLAVIALLLLRENTNLTQANAQLIKDISVADQKNRKAS